MRLNPHPDSLGLYQRSVTSRPPKVLADAPREASAAASEKSRVRRIAVMPEFYGLPTDNWRARCRQTATAFFQSTVTMRRSRTSLGRITAFTFLRIAQVILR